MTSEKDIRAPGLIAHSVGSLSITASESLWPAVSCQGSANWSQGNKL